MEIIAGATLYDMVLVLNAYIEKAFEEFDDSAILIAAKEIFEIESHYLLLRYILFHEVYGNYMREQYGVQWGSYAVKEIVVLWDDWNVISSNDQVLLQASNRFAIESLCIW